MLKYLNLSFGLYSVTGALEENKKDLHGTADMDNVDTEENKIALDSKVSDMDYLKAKVVTRKTEDSESSTSGNESSEGEDKNSDKDTKMNSEEGEESSSSDDSDSEMEVDKTENSKLKRTSQSNALTLKMRGLPFKAKEKEIMDFFSPLKLEDIRIIKNSKGKPTGAAFVDFSSEADVKEALRRNKDCMQNRYIELFRDPGEKWAQGLLSEKDFNDRPWIKKHGSKNEEEESIAEVRETASHFGRISEQLE